MLQQALGTVPHTGRPGLHGHPADKSHIVRPRAAASVCSLLGRANTALARDTAKATDRTLNRARTEK